jgi:hypothetical protein
MKHNCPNCKAELEWSTDNEFRPFCSAQCKNTDFIQWAQEEHVIAGSSLYDDILSGQIDEAEKLG